MYKGNIKCRLGCKTINECRYPFNLYSALSLYASDSKDIILNHRAKAAFMVSDDLESAKSNGNVVWLLQTLGHMSMNL